MRTKTVRDMSWSWLITRQARFYQIAVCVIELVCVCVRVLECRRSFMLALPYQCVGVCVWQWCLFDGHSSVHVYIQRSSSSSIRSSRAAAACLWTMYYCYWCSPFLSENTVFGALIWQKCTKERTKKSFRNDLVHNSTGIQCENLLSRLWATTVMRWGNF